MSASCVRLNPDEMFRSQLPLVVIVILTSLLIVEAIAQTSNDSRYDNAFREQTIEDTDWRLPLSDDFGWDPAPTTGQGRRGVTAEFNDPILDRTIRPDDRPVSRSTGMSLRFKF